MIVKARRFLFTRLILIFSVVLLLFCTVPLGASADSDTVYEGTVELTGKYNGTFQLTPDDLDLFHLKNILPGDSWEGKIHIKNKAKDTMEVSILSIVSNLRDKDLYDALELEIRVGDKLLYEGSYGDTSNPITKFYKIKPGKTVTFDVLVWLPKGVGNEMMGEEMDSTWTFEARYYGGSTGKEPVKTGFDLTQSNTRSIISAVLFVDCLLVILILLLRIRKTKEELDRQQNLSSSNGEEIKDENN